LAALIVKCYVRSFDPSSLIMVLEKAAKQWYLYCVQLAYRWGFRSFYSGQNIGRLWDWL